MQSLDVTNVGHDASDWERILRKVVAGQMPPAGLPRPKPEAAKEFNQWLEAELDKSAAAHPNPGRPTIHRLNRAEYSNAIRDLLALDIKPGSKLPADDIGYGFDNIGDVLSLSPVLIERYMAVGRLVARYAVGDPTWKAEVIDFDLPKPGKRPVKSERLTDDLPFDSAGGFQTTFQFPVDAEYVFKVKFGGTDPKVVEYRTMVKAGTRSIAATFMADNSVPEVIAGFNPPVVAAKPAANVAGKDGIKEIVKEGGKEPETAPMPRRARAARPQLDLRLDGVRLKLFDAPGARFNSFSIAGPYNTAGAGESASRQRIFTCKAATPAEEDPCARQILSTLGRRAYRRPVTESDLKPLLAFYQAGRKEGNFETGIETALRAMLVSPNFLFRVERDPSAAKPGSVYRVSDIELASRLSFFLWSSIPDNQLLSLAEKGQLKDPTVLSAQVSRMLEDRRSEAFVKNFAGQWLFLRNLSQVRPDEDAFPKFDPVLRQAFERETELFFDAVLRENRPLVSLLNANFTFLNQRLAEHYGIPGIYGSQFRRVTLTDENRGGLLGQGSILTVTSYPNRTSVVQRGKWVLENILGTPPPPPPPNIPALEAHSKDGKELTMRQQLEQHRANPVCASCHSRMDPIGFAMENYDGIGAYRTKDAGSVIDNSGKMPDGEKFAGPAGLKNLLVTSHRDEFVSTFTEKLMTYALGRGVEYYDQPAKRAIIRNAARIDPNQPNVTISNIIKAIVDSPAFQMRMAREI